MQDVRLEGGRSHDTQRWTALCRLFRSLDLHIAELDLKLIYIRQTGLA